MPAEHHLPTHEEAPLALQQLQRDPRLYVDAVQSGQQTVVPTEALQTIGAAYSFAEGTEQRLVGAVHASGNIFNIIDTEVDGAPIRLLSRSVPKNRPVLVGFIDPNGLEVRGESQTEGERGLFWIGQNEKGDLIVKNNDRLPINTAVRYEESTEAAKQRFTPKSILQGLAKAMRFRRRSQEAPRPYGQDVSEWSLARSHIERAYTEGTVPVDVASLQRELISTSPEGQRFWEQGSVKPARTFSSQLEEVVSNPEVRTNEVTSAPTPLLDAAVMRSKLHFTEREGLVNLQGFLQKVKEVASNRQDVAMVEQVERFREGFTFLGETEYQDACKGIARLWTEYVSQSPDHILNVYNHTQAGRHSYNAVFESVYKEFRAMTEGLPIADRVRMDPEAWVEGPSSKLVVVDDWTVTGTVMRNVLSVAAAHARRAGKYNLTAHMEVHVLIAGKDQTQTEWHISPDEPSPFRVRGYYQSENVFGYDVGVSGAHSSTDYGFESRLKNFSDYLASNREYEELPLLAHIAKDRDIGMAPDQIGLLEEIATANGVVHTTRKQMLAAEKRWDQDVARYNTNALTQRTDDYQLLMKSREAYDAAKNKLRPLLKTYRASDWYSDWN